MSEDLPKRSFTRTILAEESNITSIYGTAQQDAEVFSLKSSIVKRSYRT